ncbi:hypothetical protein ACLOJK_010667 [Asimina triloba]
MVIGGSHTVKRKICQTNPPLIPCMGLGHELRLGRARLSPVLGVVGWLGLAKLVKHLNPGKLGQLQRPKKGSASVRRATKPSIFILINGGSTSETCLKKPPPGGGRVKDFTSRSVKIEVVPYLWLGRWPKPYNVYRERKKEGRDDKRLEREFLTSGDLLFWVFTQTVFNLDEGINIEET